MRQPLKFAFFFLLLAAGVLSAAENLLPQDVRLYRRSNVAFREGCFVYDVKPGKWTNLAVKLPLKKGVYGCSLEVRSGGADGKTLLKLVLQPDKPAEKFRREYETKEFSETWRTLSGYLVMPEDGTANVSVYAQGPSPAEIQVRKLRLTDYVISALKTAPYDNIHLLIGIDDSSNAPNIHYNELHYIEQQLGRGSTLLTGLDSLARLLRKVAASL